MERIEKPLCTIIKTRETEFLSLNTRRILE
jgi:hypothetical protein